MPKLDSSMAACTALMVLASLAFALSFGEGTAALATGQHQPSLATAAIAAAAPPPAATVAAMATPNAIPATPSPAIAPMPTSTSAPAASPPPPQPPAAMTAPPPAPVIAVVETAGLNLRVGPGPDFPIVAVLTRGDRLALTGVQHFAGSYRWIEVLAGDERHGWVFGEGIGLP
jgi:hypothetical protein